MADKMETGDVAGKEKRLRASSIVMLVLLGILLAGSVVYYKERMLFIDGPHVLFRIINDGKLMISDFRYGSFITQLFPLLGSRLHLPLKLLMVLYSASFYIFYVTVALLLFFRYKNYEFVLLFGLYLVLFVSDTFYWPNNEVHQGMAWLFLAIAANFYIARRKRPRFTALLFFLASFYLAIWTHPLVMLVAIYLWFFLWIDKRLWPYSRVESFIFTAILLLLSFLKFNQGRRHGYDSTKIEVISGFHAGGISEIFASRQFHFFVKNCFTNYWLFLLVFIAGVIATVWHRKMKAMLLTVLFAVGYLVLVFITFKEGGNRFYIESEYMPLSIICSVPFVFFVLPRLGNRVGPVAITLICIVRLIYIYQAAPAFTNRVAIMDRIINKMKEKGLTKVIIAGPVPAIDSMLIMNWGAPVESILLSQIKGDDPQRTFIFAGGDELKAFMNVGKDTFIGCWDLRPDKKLNHYYFMTDTTAKYKVVSYNDLMGQ